MHRHSRHRCKHSESCTWFLEAKSGQSSLVAHYTVFAAPPSDLTTYYKQLIQLMRLVMPGVAQ